MKMCAIHACNQLQHTRSTIVGKNNIDHGMLLGVNWTTRTLRINCE